MWLAKEFLKDYNIFYWTEGKNIQKGWVGITCPFCNDNSNHGGFNLEKGYYNCWRCGGKQLETVIMKLIDVDYHEAKRIKDIYTYTKINNIEEKRQEINWNKKIKIPGTENLKGIYRKYLEYRNFDPVYIERKYKVRNGDITGKWCGYIIIPFIYKNKLVTFQGRDVTGKNKIRYKQANKEERILNYKNYLYNIDNTTYQNVIVVEGVFDVFRMGDNTVATLGSGITREQENILKKYKRVYFLFDDEVAIQKAEKTANKLAILGVDTEIVEIRKDKDPAEFTEQEVKYIKKELLV